MQHYCMALNYSDELSFLWSPFEDNRARCGAPAHFMARVNRPADRRQAVALRRMLRPVLRMDRPRALRELRLLRDGARGKTLNPEVFVPHR